MMISFGGVIGTGLFLSSGYTVATAGPVGTILAYCVGAVIVYLVMLCLGELSVAMPETGAFHVYATRFLAPATGTVTAVLYWLTWTVALGSEFTGAAMIMKGWFPSTPTWMWAALFIALILAINITSVRVFAEAETILSSLKVAAIIAFIVLGSLAIVGLYASTRMLWSLANEGTVPRALARTNRFGVPALAMGLSMVGGLTALATSVVAASTVYLVLVSVSGLAVVLVWVAIAASHLSFRRRWVAQGRSTDELGYAAPGYPWVSVAALLASAASCLLIVVDPAQRPALWMTAGFVGACYVTYWVAARRITA